MNRNHFATWTIMVAAPLCLGYIFSRFAANKPGAAHAALVPTRRTRLARMADGSVLVADRRRRRR